VKRWNNNSQIVDLSLPLSKEQARKLELGSIVTVSGLVFTGRSLFHIRAVEQDLVPPIDFRQINCFFHVGPVMLPDAGGWKVLSIEPTSSIRFEKYAPAVIRKLKLRTLIGKTTMGPATAQALAEVGGVHLSKIGICGNQISQQVVDVQGVHFLRELGKTEATWIFEVRRFGPFFVDIDARGNNYFENQEREKRLHLVEVYRQLGIPEGYEYTSVESGSRGSWKS
jgi:tartrate/fumarate subfamily iron-sulfur-dependent hydro-lyase beta chain